MAIAQELSISTMHAQFVIKVLVGSHFWKKGNSFSLCLKIWDVTLM
jgi:hypothetical protein